MEDLQQTEKNVRAHEQTYKVGMNDNADPSNISDSELGDTLHILEQVRNATLSSAEPSPQDLRVAQSVDAQIQHMLNNSNVDEVATNESEPSFVRDIIEVKVLNVTRRN